MAILRVEGLTELRQALQQMSKDAPKELAKANKQVGQIVVAEAIRRAPRGKHQGGGHVMPIAASISASLSADHVRVTAGGGAAPHAAPTEFGGYIARRGFKGINRRGKIEAHKRGHQGILTHVKKQPYLLPAIAAKLADVVIAYERAMDGVIAKFEGR